MKFILGFVQHRL